MDMVIIHFHSFHYHSHKLYSITTNKPFILSLRNVTKLKCTSYSKYYIPNGKSQPNPKRNSNSIESSPNGATNLENNNHLRKFVKIGELDQAFKLLQRMSFEGGIPDVFVCTGLIRQFCKTGKTKKATRVMEIIEASGAVPNVRAYNGLINGYCKSGEIEKALQLLERMSVSPDVVTFTVLINWICKEGRLDEAIKLFSDMASYGCKPDVVTYNTVIDGLSKVGATEHAVELLDEMWRKGLKPNVITHSSVIGGFIREKSFLKLERSGIRINALTYNSIMLGLCKARQTSHAIDLLACMSMIANGCKPTEATYRILIEGIAYEGLAEEAMELFNELCSRGFLKKSSAEKVLVNI